MSINKVAKLKKINIKIWAKERYRQIINSIAFYPAIIALLFLILSALSIAFDFSEGGKQLKSQLQWLRLKDPSTARSIISSIAAGIITLTVFSFSMVMIVLNQTASQLSNRILDKLIGSRFQQIVLGIYVGTIVYALFLLSTIRDIDNGIHIPALSTYLLIVLTVCDIFLFIYFLHYITQSVKYNVIIQRIHKETNDALERTCHLDIHPDLKNKFEKALVISCPRSGIYEGVSENALIDLCDKNEATVFILATPGDFILEGIPLIKSNKRLPDVVVEEIQSAIYIHTTESIEGNFFYGFRQLSEVAIKALSPGINDPGTAIQALRALFELLSYKVCHFQPTSVRNKNGEIRIIMEELTFQKIFESTILPIWDYGKEDRLIQHELMNLLLQIQSLTPHESIAQLMLVVDSHSKLSSDRRLQKTYSLLH